MFKTTRTNRTTKNSIIPNKYNKNTRKSSTTNLNSAYVSSSSSRKSNSLNKYKPPYNSKRVYPEYWELPNRKNFFNWVSDTFKQYDTSNTKLQQNEEIPIMKEQMMLNNIQRLTRDYLQGESPVRGLLLYIGLGHGKTCAAITISEAILTKKEVIVVSKANLEDNFKKEIRKCGSDYVKTMNHWVFNKCISLEEKQLGRQLGIPTKSINENGGAFFADFTKTSSNYNTLSPLLREKLDNQIEHIVSERFEFIHFDNPRKWNVLKEGLFDNKIIIVDEVHNIGNTMASQSSPSADKYYNLFMNAKNPKYIFLSGTPIINNIFEITKIYNILRGYMRVLEIRFKNAFDTPIDYNKIRNAIKDNKYIDQIIINKTQKLIKVTKNPDNFINSNTTSGIIYKPDTQCLDTELELELELDTSISKSQWLSLESRSRSSSISKSSTRSKKTKHNKHNGVLECQQQDYYFKTFQDEITHIIQNLGYKIIVTEGKPETCFSTDKLEFEQMFYNIELNKLKKTDLIKRRIAGLTSYYEYPDKALYPELLPINKLQIPMSEFQFGSYERFRHQEIEKDKYNKVKQDDDSQLQQSSYRIKSRLVCSFVFPEDIGSPYDSKLLQDKLELYEKIGDILSYSETDRIVGKPDKHKDKDKDSNIDITIQDNMENATVIGKELDKAIRHGYIELLGRDKAKYLDIANGSLLKYSPKYYAMIMNIQKERGKQLVYSYFRNLIGLETFSYALIQTGKWAKFRIKKRSSSGGKATKSDTIWELDEYPDEIGKSKFIFYTGLEDKDIRAIYVNIYNSTWDNLPQSCSILKKQLEGIRPNNYYGELIKLLMTTRTGAEGLDLKEVRYIHIMEPYWQPVLLEQIIGRGVRNGSHLKLKKEDRTVEVFIYMATLTPALVRKISYIDVRNDVYKYAKPALTDKAFKVVSSDEYLYLTAERKKAIIGDFQKLMKETAFDCSLNYRDNTQNPINTDIVCMDYPNKNRDDYLFTPSIDDTIENIDLAQEKVVVEQYGKLPFKGKIYYYNKTPNSNGKMFIYDETLKTRVRTPNPIGEVNIVNGKMQYGFYKLKAKK